jgi:hypothetical protein
MELLLLFVFGLAHVLVPISGFAVLFGSLEGDFANPDVHEYY